MGYTIQVDTALPRIHASHLLQTFQILAREMSKISGVSERHLLDGIVDTESQDSSTIGKGVAIPHFQSSAIPRRFVAIATLDKAIHMDTPDNKAVDLICLLLSPESDGPIHLRGLSRISRLLRNEELCQVLRETKDGDAMKALFVNPEGWLMAA